jgi:hypothetical protein
LCHNDLADVRLIRDNCKAFNGEKANISVWAAQIVRIAEKTFVDKKVLVLVLSLTPKHLAPVPHHYPVPLQQVARPKREHHAPIGRDPNLSPTTPTGSGKRLLNLITQGPKRNWPEFRFCAKVLKELLSNKISNFSWPFLTPVDYVALGIPGN